MAMALLCELPHSGTHRLWFDHKSMLFLPSNAMYPPSGRSLPEKIVLGFIGSKHKTYLSFASNSR